MRASSAKAGMVTSSLPGQEAQIPHWTDIDWGPSIANRLINDLQVHYLDYGSGPPLFYCMAWPPAGNGGSRTFRHWPGSTESSPSICPVSANLSRCPGRPKWSLMRARY